MKTASSPIHRGLRMALFTCLFTCLGTSLSSRANAVNAEKASASSDKLPMLSARADAALKRIERDESLQKITSAPPTDNAQSEERVSADDGGTEELVKISPAPGTSGKAEPTAENAQAPIAIETATVEPASVSVPAPTPGSQPSVAEKAMNEKPVAKPAAKAAAEAASEIVSAEQSLKWLTNGNMRYVKKHFRADGRMPTDRQRLLAGQKPHAIVLSCSDSRVPPEIVFDQALGEIFVIRVAGEALDSSVIGSIEYAVEHFDTRLLVVMGHTQCGAVEAVLKAKDGESAGSEALDKLLADIKPRLKSVMSQKPSGNLEVESTLNADGVARDLVKRSEILRKKVEAGELVIKPALYRLDSGKVSFY